MKKGILWAVSALLLICSGASVMSLFKASSSDLFKANVVALANDANESSIGETIREVLGCPGGQNKCFTGSVKVGPVETSGTWYLP